MADDSETLRRRISPLLKKKPRYLEGPDGERWELELEDEVPGWMAKNRPPGALIFANNGVGDYLFLAPDCEVVRVYRHEGPELGEYCSEPAELLPDRRRPPSDYPPVRYWKSDEAVRLGDLVEIRLLLFWKHRGRVVYVPGISPMEPSMEKDGVWVRVKLEDGGTADTVVLDGRNELQRTVVLLLRSGAVLS